MKKNAFIVLLFASKLFAGIDPGDLDPTFGNGGRVFTEFTGFDDEIANAMVIQPDGKIVVAGSVDTPGGDVFGLVRYNTDGSLDNSFGDGGKVINDFIIGLGDTPLSLAIQKDGKLIAGGFAGVANYLVARYNTDGSLDNSFGENGLAQFFFLFFPGLVRRIVIQEDKKIVLVGATNTGQRRYVIARLNVNGSLDTTFNPTGVLTGVPGLVVTTFVLGDDSFGLDLLVQQNGKLIIGGYTDGGTNPDNFGLARYNIDGSLDTTFGLDGSVITDFNGGNDLAFNLALQRDGKIIATGETNIGPNPTNFAMARYNMDGSLDATFNPDGLISGKAGLVVTDFGINKDRSLTIALQMDGKIILGGEARFSSSTIFGPTLFAMARYNTNGTLDLKFGNNGLVTTSFDRGSHDVISAINVQADGKIVASGISSDSNFFGKYIFASARYLSGVQVSKAAQAIFGKYALFPTYRDRQVPTQ